MFHKIRSHKTPTDTLDLANNDGDGGETKSTMDIRIVKLGKKWKDWFKPALNIHTTLYPDLASIFLFAPLQIRSQNETILRYKKIYGVHCPPHSPPPEVTTMTTGKFEVQANLLYMFLDG